ncbi:MAG: type I-C CRISPR-associated protein Cas8c/Csd1 [Nitrospirota bacterium]|nr:type I-C CRISPR-associated protein Cas8c/Csd1 [Nitrospirota bacterium]
MSWIEKLYQTYENNIAAIGDPKDAVPLLPICHTTQNAHVTITIDTSGNFLGASVVQKAEARTIIPATEKSAGRTRGTTPHPLCDKLQYVAGDYESFGGEKEACFEKYYELLNKWFESDSKQWKLKAITAYVAKKMIIADLVKAAVLHVDKETSKLLAEWPETRDKPEIFNQLAGESWQADAFVRWRVERPGHPQSDVWSDRSLWKSWELYYCSLESRKGMCYVTGIKTDLATQHPSKIRNDGDKAKLISSGKTAGKDGKDKVDDGCGFTFLGRFTTADEACGVGFKVTQEAHSALRWLIARQGKRGIERSFVAWAVTGVKVPDPLADTLSLVLGTAEESEQEEIVYTAEHIGNQLAKLIAGYSARLGNTSNVVVMALDAATPGRMSINYYRELTGSEFLKRIESWHTGCSWQQYFGKDRIFYGAPAPRDIAEVAYGRRVDEKLKKATITRLLPCIVDAAPIPRDLVESCIRRASSRNGIEYWEWEKALGIACALYRKLNEKEGFSMALDEDRNTRDYLYGRLLALSENLERWALKEASERRPTNAERMMQRFAEHPYSTWRTIELALVPYKNRLGGKANKMLALIDGVHCKFDPPEEFLRDDKLSGEFLLGYHCQRAALKPPVVNVSNNATTDPDGKIEDSGH